MFGHYPHGSSFHSDLPQYQVHLHIQVYMLSLQRFPLLLSSLQTVLAIYFSYMEIFGEKPDMGTGTYRPRNSHQWSTDNKTPLRHSCLFLTYRSRAGNHGDHAQTLSQNRLLNNLFFTEHFLNQRNPRDPRGYSTIGWKLLPFSKHSFWFRAFSQVML